MPPRKSLSLALIAGSFALAVTGCSYMEDMPGPDKPGNEAPKMCTKEYQPVCGAKGYKRKTFGNACEAKASGYSVVKEGECGK